MCVILFGFSIYSLTNTTQDWKGLVNRPDTEPLRAWATSTDMLMWAQAMGVDMSNTEVYSVSPINFPLFGTTKTIFWKSGLTLHSISSLKGKLIEIY